jgi:hypothetical protein
MPTGRICSTLNRIEMNIGEIFNRAGRNRRALRFMDTFEAFAAIHEHNFRIDIHHIVERLTIWKKPIFGCLSGRDAA